MTATKIFAKVPLRLLSEVSPSSVVLYAALRSRCNPKRDKGVLRCWPSMQTICTDANLSKATVIRCTRELVRTKWVFVDRREFPGAHGFGEGMSNIYMLSPNEPDNFWEEQI